MNKAFFPQTLLSYTAQFMENLQASNPPFLRDFYLSGGTALSLQLGHRESEDLDFFTKQAFSPEKLEQELKAFGQRAETEIAAGTLNAFINQVKLQFLFYPYPLLEPTINFNGISISSIRDIACTKLQTVGMRGHKKDFIDLYFIFETYPLRELLEAVAKKYEKSNYSQSHIVKSLVYFDDADGQPTPRMHKPVDWDTVKQKMIEEVKTIVF